jgi:hypothetical protein
MIAQLTWCRKAAIARAIITHCGSGIVSAEPHATAMVSALGEQRGVLVRVAHDGLKVTMH